MSASPGPTTRLAAPAPGAAIDHEAECRRLAAALQSAEAERVRTQLQLQRYVEDLLLVNRQRKAALAAAARAAAVQTRFLGEVSNDLRGPLTSIVGFSELLARDPDTGHRADFADRMRQAALRLNGLVDQLIDVARHGGAVAAPAAEVVPVEPATLLATAIDAARPATAALGVTVRLEPLAPGLQPLAVDAGRAAQALATLLEDLARRQPWAELRLTQAADDGGHATLLTVTLAATAAPSGLGWMIAGALLESVGAALSHRTLSDGSLCVTVAWAATA